MAHAAPLTVVRLPLLVLVGALVLYLSAFSGARIERTNGLDTGVTVSILPDMSSGETPNPQAAIALLRTALTQTRSTAVYRAVADAGVGLGIYDSTLRWKSLPFGAEDYTSGASKVSFRFGSGAGVLKDHVHSALGFETVTRDFNGEQDLQGIDYVYPLLAIKEVRGELAVEGLPEDVLATMTTGIRGLGYEVTVGPIPSFWSEVSGAPMVWLMTVILLLAWASATASWTIHQLELGDRLQREVLLGATPLGAASRQLPLALWAWCFAAFGAVVLTSAFALSFRIPVPANLILVGGAVLLLDLVIALLIYWVKARSLARLAAG